MSTSTSGSSHTPKYTPADQSPIAQLSGQVRGLEQSVRKLVAQYEQWVEGMGELMCYLDATAAKLEGVAADLLGLDPPQPPSYEEEIPF